MAVGVLGETRTVRGYCGLCAVHCPTVATVRDGQVLSLQPDASHPYGGAMCAKGRAAPELHDHPDRVNYPLRRTRPKTDPDPGWQRCTWDEALEIIANKLLAVRAESGAQAVAFSKGTGGATGLTDTEQWLTRLANYFGTPNLVGTTHLCQWPRDTAAANYTFGTDRLAMPDVARSGCIVLWGSNPNANFLSLARDVVAAKKRGAKLLVVDPRRIGLANKADVLLQVRPGTDGALALSLVHLLITEGWYDEGFARDWTNGPLLVRGDTGQLLRAEDLATTPSVKKNGHDSAIASGSRFLAACQDEESLIVYDAARGVYDGYTDGLILRGSRKVRLADGGVAECRPVFDCLAALAAEYPPERAAEITGVPAGRIIEAASLLSENRPVSHYFHNGLVQHTNATQASRAVAVLYALLGDFDRPGGNVVAPGPKVNAMVERSALPQEMAERRLGRQERPIGPPVKPGQVAAYDLYKAILDQQPYPVRALVAFGANMLLSNGDSLQGRKALEQLEFFAQVELFHTPTSRYADVLLPAASFLESEALKVGFRYPVEAMAHLQRRPAVVDPLYERRSDVEIIFGLACRLGLSERFWNGSVDAAFDYLLEPSGLTWKSLGELPYGVSAPRAPLRYQKYAEVDAETSAPKGFATPTRKVELFAQPFASHGQPPLPFYVEPAFSPVSQPELAREFPLILTNAKRAQYLHSQHRGLPSIRKTAPNPTAEMHPNTASRYAVAQGDWISVETPNGSARAQADLTASIVDGVVCMSHGWWQGCEELGLAPLDPFSPDGANINLLVHNEHRDPVSGSTPHRSSLCRIRK